MAFNFAFLYEPWRAYGFLRRIEEWEHLPRGIGWPNYTLSNHDKLRHITRYAKGRETQNRARVAAAMLLTLRGTPFLYYGEEIGMSSRRIPRKDIMDPLGKRRWPFFQGRDPARTPMQWGNARNAGFSKGNPWLPVNSDFVTVNVEAQDGDPGSLLNFYRKVIWLRKHVTALALGDYQSVSVGAKDVLAYTRVCEGQTVLVLLNFVNQTVRVQRTEANRDGQTDRWKVLFGTHRGPDEPFEIHRTELRGYEVLIAEKM